jgi:hypothetical protein
MLRNKKKAWRKIMIFFFKQRKNEKIRREEIQTCTQTLYTSHTHALLQHTHTHALLQHTHTHTDHTFSCATSAMAVCGLSLWWADHRTGRHFYVVMRKEWKKGKKMTKRQRLWKGTHTYTHVHTTTEGISTIPQTQASRPLASSIFIFLATEKILHRKKKKQNE